VTGPTNTGAAAAADYGDLPWPADNSAKATESVKGRSADAEAHDAREANDDMYAIHQAVREQQALSRLPEDQQAQFQQVRDAAEKSGVPDAGHAVDKLLKDGTFQNNPDLLPQLAQLATQPQFKDVAAADSNAGNRMVGELVRQIADPSIIKQDPAYDTCGEANIEQQMAQQDPAQYVKFVSDLASADRQAHAPDGTHIELDALQIDSADKSDRSMASTLFQMSLHAHYAEKLASDGTSASRMDGMVQAMFPGKEVVTVSPENQAAAMAAIKPGSTAFLDTDRADGEKHAVNVMAVDRDKGQVYYIDPNGEMKAQSLAEFQSRLAGAVLPKDSGVPNSNANWDIGTGGTSSTTGSGSRSR
jgi:hypothetical protein